MKHFNAHLPAAIDVETTGLIPGYHDLIQICILILDSDFKPDKRMLPFYINIKPKRPHNIDPSNTSVLFRSREKFAKMMQRALDPWDAADLFEQWFESLKQKAFLPEKKKLLPIAQNWVFDREFIIDWLDGLCDPVNGKHLNFDSFFHPWYRDTLATAQYLNDRYVKDQFCVFDWKVPFPKSNLAYLCSQLKIKNLQHHDALQDAIVTAEIYRKMVNVEIP